MIKVVAGNKPIKLSTQADKVYTPQFIVEEVMALLKPFIGEGGLLLEPHRGTGAFYDNYPEECDKLWCEIDDGVDFFSFTQRVDWIITNPPYSIFAQCLAHSLTLADEIVYVIPVNKLLASMPRLMQIKRAGFNIKWIHYLGSGRQLKFPFGFPTAMVWISKGYRDGSTKITYADRLLTMGL